MSSGRREKALGISVWYREDRGYWMGDFRRYANGGREKLTDPDGEAIGTPLKSDGQPPVSVQRAVSRRLDVLEGKGPVEYSNPGLVDYARRWLSVGDYAEESKRGYQSRIRMILRFYEVARGVEPEALNLDQITTADLNDFKKWRRENMGVSDLTIHHDLVALKSLFSFAVNERAVPENPVDRVDLPSDANPEPNWLEVGEAARLLKAAEEVVQDKASRALPFMDNVVALWLLTGLTRSEGFGLLVEDVDLEAGKIQVRPNEHRPLKNRHRRREVPIWPQLRPYLKRQLSEFAEDYPEGLLFPAPRTGKMVNNPHRSYKEVVRRAKLPEDEVTIHTLRHTYCATRLQTLDGGHPVSPYVVAKELGHAGLNMVEKVYGHVQERRQRLPEVRYQEADVVSLEERRDQRTGS